MPHPHVVPWSLSFAPAVSAASASDAADGGTVFVFPGHLSHRSAGPAQLLDSAPFDTEMRRCDAALAEFLGWSVLDAVRGGAGSANLHRVEVAQPVLFATSVSLASQWRATGIRPDAVLGHSQGEIAAAYVAGALSLRDAAKVVALGSRAVGAIAGTGGMVSLRWPAEHVLKLIEPWRESISVAAEDSPSSTVVTGDRTALNELLATCKRDDLPCNSIPVDYVLHSSRVEPLRDTLRDSLAALQPQAGDSVFVSTVTGAALDTSILDCDYWFANLRQPVLFEQALRWSYEHGYRTFVQAGPYPGMSAAIRESLPERDVHHSVGRATAVRPHPSDHESATTS
jgi:polyketide synthase 12